MYSIFVKFPGFSTKKFFECCDYSFSSVYIFYFLKTTVNGEISDGLNRFMYIDLTYVVSQSISWQ